MKSEISCPLTDHSKIFFYLIRILPLFLRHRRNPATSNKTVVKRGWRSRRNVIKVNPLRTRLWMLANDLAYKIYSRVVTSTQNYRITIIGSDFTKKKLGSQFQLEEWTRKARFSRDCPDPRVEQSERGTQRKSIGASIKLRMHAVYRF